MGPFIDRGHAYGGNMVSDVSSAPAARHKEWVTRCVYVHSTLYLDLGERAGSNTRNLRDGRWASVIGWLGRYPFVRYT